ncbi:MAG: hypothetical protein EXR52_04860 [Dehalococcoidia bacterium]|nr:hypothetical protein [Dehalococcoidia bacterium]
MGLFTNAGTLIGDAGAGGFRGMSGNVTNTGSITFNQTGIMANLTLTNTGFVVLNAPVVGNGNPVTINQNGGSITGAGALSLTNLAFNYNADPVSAPVFLTNGTLTTSGAAIGGAAFTLRGSGSTLAGTISPSTTVSIVGGTATGFGSAWIGPGTINNGTFRLTSTAATSAHIVTLGLFTNAGTLLADAGAGGIRGMAGNATNTGSITFNQTGILADLTLTNTGSIVLNAPVVGNGNPVTINQNGGSFTGLGALTLTHLAFNYNTGPVTPPVFLTNGTLTISGAAIGGATFTLWGSGSTLTGTISPSTTVVVQGSGADAVVSAAAGLTNLGSITLTSAGGPWGASLTAGGAGLSNSGALNVAAGTGGARALGGHLLNTTAGTFTVGATTTVSTAAASHINQGAVTLAGGTLLTVSGVGAALTNTGTIGGAGSLVLDGVTLNGTGSVTHTLLAGTAAVSPGLPTGQLTMTGSYIHGAGTSLNVSLGGNNPGVTFDQLRVLGTATLTDGTLNVTVSGGFVSCDGAVFDVLTYGARIGTFGTLNGLTIGPGHTLSIAYLANAFRLTSNGGSACVTGGKNLKMTTGSIDLSWTGGNAQAGYTLLQYNTSTGVATLISLAANATSYSDTAAANGVMYCYVLVPTSSDGAPLGLSDLLCGMAGMEGGDAIPSGFALTLEQTANATMTWTAPAGGATSYLLVRIPLDGSPVTSVALPGAAVTSTQAVVAAGTCFQLLAYQGVVFGNSDVLCVLPGVSTLNLASPGPPRLSDFTWLRERTQSLAPAAAGPKLLALPTRPANLGLVPDAQ